MAFSLFLPLAELGDVSESRNVEFAPKAGPGRPHTATRRRKPGGGGRAAWPSLPGGVGLAMGPDQQGLPKLFHFSELWASCL